LGRAGILQGMMSTSNGSREGRDYSFGGSGITPVCGSAQPVSQPSVPLDVCLSLQIFPLASVEDGGRMTKTIYDKVGTPAFSILL